MFNVCQIVFKFNFKERNLTAKIKNNKHRHVIQKQIILRTNTVKNEKIKAH